MYNIEGYDKDGDRFLYLCSTHSLQSALVKARQYQELCRRDALRYPKDGEPIDWIEISKNGNLIWASGEYVSLTA